MSGLVSLALVFALSACDVLVRDTGGVSLSLDGDTLLFSVCRPMEAEVIQVTTFQGRPERSATVYEVSGSAQLVEGLTLRLDSVPDGMSVDIQKDVGIENLEEVHVFIFGERSEQGITAIFTRKLNTLAQEKWLYTDGSLHATPCPE